MENRLSPELQAVQDEFIENLSVGGIEAVKPILTRLAVERAMLEIYHNHFVQMEYEDEDLFKLHKFDELADYLEIVNFANDVADDHNSATERHNLVASMLGTLLSRPE